MFIKTKRARSWSNVALLVIRDITIRALQGTYMGALTGLVAGGFCGLFFPVLAITHSTSVTVLLGMLVGTAIGAAIGAISFAIQSASVLVHNPVRWFEVWYMARTFLWPVTISLSLAGGFSGAAFWKLVAAYAEIEPLHPELKGASSGFVIGSLFGYVIGIVITALMPDGLEQAHDAWMEWWNRLSITRQESKNSR